MLSEKKGTKVHLQVFASLDKFIAESGFFVHFQ